MRRPRSSLSLGCLCALLLAACGHQHPRGRMNYTEVASTSEARPMRYGLYTPPNWDGHTPLPLVLLLHGAGDDETSADRAVVTKKLDEAIDSGQVPPFFMVTPQGDRGFWLNWNDGSHHFRDWVLTEVVPNVRRDVPIVEGPAGLHLMGVSMGGGGGLQMWLHDPSQFASATILSAPILTEAETFEFLARYMPRAVMVRAFGEPGKGEGTDPYVALNGAEALRGSTLMVGVASRDRRPMLDSTRRFDQHLRDHNVPHHYVEFPGGHGWQAWSDAFVWGLCHQLQESCGMQAPSSWTTARSGPSVTGPSAGGTCVLARSPTMTSNRRPLRAARGVTGSVLETSGRIGRGAAPLGFSGLAIEERHLVSSQP